MIPDPGIAEAIHKLPEANLQERLRAQARHLRGGDRDKAIETFRTSLYSELATTITEAIAQENIGTALPMLIDSTPLLRASGRLSEGDLWLDQVLQHPESREQPRILLMRSHLALGQIRIALGDYERAIPPLRKALSISEALQDKHAAIIVSNQLALACDRLGRYTEAQVLYQNAIQVGQLTDNEADLCMLHISLSASYLLAGDFAKANTAAKQALSYSGGSKENIAFGRMNEATALLALHHPDASDAVRAILPAATATQEPILILYAQLFQSFLETDAAQAQKSVAALVLALKQQGAALPPVLTQLLHHYGFLKA